MESASLSIMLGVFITLVGFVWFNYKKLKSNTTQVALWGLLSFMISFLLLKVKGEEIYYIGLFGGVAITSIFNYLTVRGDVDIHNIPKSLGIFLLFFCSSIFQLVPIILFNLDIENLTLVESLYLSLFSDLVLLIVLGFIYFKTLKDNFIKLKKNLFATIDSGFKYWLIGLACMAVSNIIIGLLLPDAQAVNENSVQDMIASSAVISLIAIGLLAPIIEELVFRKAFRDVFRNKKIFVLVSGLVFGSLHVLPLLSSLGDIFYIIPYSSLGISFAYMYVKTDNIYTSIMMHMFHNTVLTTLSIISMGAMII